MARQDSTMTVKVYSPFKTYFDGLAISLSAVNDTGPFDILPGHKNFMSLLKACTVNVRVPQKPDFNLPISHGVMHVKTNQVTIFLDV
ncbi:hypothetical protein COU91_01905 [Candidatus Saccharibacteria bacterium CG10_big_fil_rev_8_21_14_0_10_47_8]|nr:MAG: hypothetical protein COU91_01905 [Candidatus Saccharibacteria bacterium CG10_big_fil_rev_8_21_14_0_10_47_8]